MPGFHFFGKHVRSGPLCLEGYGVGCARSEEGCGFGFGNGVIATFEDKF